MSSSSSSSPSKPTTEWAEIPYPKLQNSYGHTSTLFKDYMITFGGRSESWRFDFHGISILNLKTNSSQKFKQEGEKPQARCRHSSCLFDSNKILIFGGFSKEGLMGHPAIISIEETSRYNSSFQKIDTELSLNYKEIRTTGGKDLARYGHSADVYKNKMYVFGGRHQEKPKKINHNELWTLNLETFHWEYCVTKGERPSTSLDKNCFVKKIGERTAHSSAIYEGKLYIFGGFCDTAKQALKDCHVISLETMEWKKLSIKGVDFIPRYGASCAISNDNIYIIGGGPDLSGQNQVLCYNTKNNRLKYVNSNGKYIPIRFASAIQYKNSLVLWGGLLYNGRSIAEIKRLQLDSQASKNVCSLEVAHLLESEQHSDIKFSIEGQIIPAHKLVLALRCKYFSGLFSSGMKESYSQVIELTDVKIETFKAFLKFLYENEIDLMTESLALDLYILADKYMQKELVLICEEFIAENFSLGTLEAMIYFPEHFGSAKFFKKKKRAIQE